MRVIMAKILNDDYSQNLQESIDELLLDAECIADDFKKAADNSEVKTPYVIGAALLAHSLDFRLGLINHTLERIAVALERNHTN